MSEALPFFSVCIPTYNRATLLGAAIESVLAQDFGDYELVVVDNASNDATSDVLGRYSGARVRVHRNAATVGMYANHNACVARARAPWIVFLHSDERLVPTALGSIRRAIAAAPADLGLVIPAGDRDVVRCMTSRPWYGPVVGPPETLLLAMSGIGQPSGACYARRALEAVGGFDEGGEVAYAADHDLYARLASTGWSFALVSDPVELHEPGEHQASHALARTGATSRAIARFALNMSRRPSWPTAIDALLADVADWPAPRVAYVLYVLAIAGLRREYRAVRDATQWRADVRRDRTSRVADAVATFGPTSYFSALAVRRSLRELMRVQ